MGLDEILGGGLIPSCSYLLRGGPGTGKTTVGLHFLSQGAEKGERTLLITLSEPASKIRGNALGRFSLDGVNFLDLTPSADDISGEPDYTIFSPPRGRTRTCHQDDY